MMTTTESPTVRQGSGRDADGWRAQTVNDEAALAGLMGEWDDLYERCGSATAFGSGAWLESWWRSYGRSGRLVVVVVRHAGRLVAAAPLMRRRRFGVSVLTSIGAGISDFTDVLIDDSCAPNAASHLARELATLREWDAIELAEVPDGAAAWHLVDAWPLRTWKLPGSVCSELSVRPMKELIETLPRQTARTRRKKERRIEAAGVDAQVVPGRAAGEAVAVMLRLHQQQWRGRGMNREHGRARFAAHLARAVPAMVERGQAVVVEYRLNGDVVAVDLLMDGHRMMCAYLYGFRPDLRRRIDVTQLFLGTDLELAHRLGRPTLSLLRGDESHKRHWRPRETRNHRVLLAGPRLPANLYAVALRDRRRLAQIVKTRLPLMVGARRRFKACLPFST
jgi:CelD/BcsL family acetyltransferase involved in cellulose biosynthesis